MSDESGGPDGRPASEIMTDQLAQKVGQQVLDALMSAGLTIPAQRRGVVPVDIGRLVFAYATIEDPRVRSEFVSLIETISGSAPR